MIFAQEPLEAFYPDRNMDMHHVESCAAVSFGYEVTGEIAKHIGSDNDGEWDEEIEISLTGESACR